MFFFVALFDSLRLLTIVACFVYRFSSTDDDEDDDGDILGDAKIEG